MKFKLFTLTILAMLLTVQSARLCSMHTDQEMITLVGSDKNEIQIPRDLALQSGTIKSFLEIPSFLEAKTNRIEFHHISTANLKTIFDLQKAIVQNAKRNLYWGGDSYTRSVLKVIYRELRDKKSKMDKYRKLEQFLRIWSPYQDIVSAPSIEIQNLLLGSNFLNLPLLKNALAHWYVHNLPEFKLSELKEGLVEDLFELIDINGTSREFGFEILDIDMQLPVFA